MDLQRSEQQEDEKVVVRDVTATSLEVITEVLEDKLRITEPIVSIASTGKHNFFFLHDQI